jgi:hypothetical protein
MKHKGSASV